MANRDAIALSKNAQRGLRRRLYAALRLAHRVLGMRRKRLGLGLLGPGSASGVVALAVGGVCVVTPAFAGNGIFINDGTDTGCSFIVDSNSTSLIGNMVSGTVANNWYGTGGGIILPPTLSAPSPTLMGPSSNPCLTTDKATQTGRALFYNPAGNNAGSNSLTLGGELYVNSGNLGLGGGQAAAQANSIRIGDTVTLGDTNSGANSVALGVGTLANGANAIAIGQGANAAAANAVALGSGATSTFANSVALGAGATTSRGGQTYTDPITGNSATSVGEVSVGNASALRQITNVAPGVDRDRCGESQPIADGV